MNASPRAPHQPDASDPGRDAADHPWARGDDTPDRMPPSASDPSDEGAGPATSAPAAASGQAVAPTATVRIVQGHPTGFEPGVNKGGQNGSPKPDGRSAKSIALARPGAGTHDPAEPPNGEASE